jgi:transposase
MRIKTVGIDIGKTVFHLVAMDELGKIVAKKRFSRSQLLAYTANLQTCLIGMEACCEAHYLGRMLASQSHDVRLIPAQFVKPFLKSNKNDYLDAEAIAEAVQRPSMRFVPLKSEEQLDLQALHRVRDRLVSRQTSVINQLRAFLLERGITFRKGRLFLRKNMPAILEDAGCTLSPRMQFIIHGLWREWIAVENQIAEATAAIEQIAKQDEGCRRLVEVPGVGALVASAMVAAVGNGSAFARGREFSAWLGLVPKQYSTGGKAKLLGISKRGNQYLRRLFIHGSRSVLAHVRRETHPLGPWMNSLETRMHRNVAAVAVANKLARIAWAVLYSGQPYRWSPMEA